MIQIVPSEKYFYIAKIFPGPIYRSALFLCSFILATQIENLNVFYADKWTSNKKSILKGARERKKIDL